MKLSVAIVGCGGYAKVVLDMAVKLNLHIVGFFDDEKTHFCGYPVLGKISDMTAQYKYILAIGDSATRKRIVENTDVLWVSIVHPSCIVARSVRIGKGTVICAGAIIQPGVGIGEHCIVNTNANVDHECQIGNFSSICPGVTICGNVTIGECSFIGAHAVIIQKISIGSNCVVGAGSVIIRNINSGITVVGNPGREILV